MGREQVTRSLIHILSKQIHLFTKWVMLCEVIDFRMPSVFSEALASRLWHYQPQVPPYSSPQLGWTEGTSAAGIGHKWVMAYTTPTQIQ